MFKKNLRLNKITIIFILNQVKNLTMKNKESSGLAIRKELYFSFLGKESELRPRKGIQKIIKLY